MASMTVAEFSEVVKGRLWGNKSAEIIINIVTDSRKVQKGSLFVAIRGENFDGHRFMQQALEAGAVAVLSEQSPTSDDMSIIQVENCQEAMADLGRACLEQYPVTVVAITGSVGKTSCKEMTASVLSEKFCVLKTAGNLNTETGLPITLYRLEKKHQVVVLEMGMQGPGEISHLAKIAPPDFAVITNILGVHLERLGSIEAIAKAKAELLQELKPTGVAFFREDEPWKEYLIQQMNGASYSTYGFAAKADVSVSNHLTRGLEGSTFSLTLPNGVCRKAEIALPGRHMVENASLAAAIGYFMGLTADEIVEGLRKTQPMMQRSDVLKLSGDRIIINDCYNSSPASLKASLELMKDLRMDRYAGVVLADMKELGVSEVQEHLNIGERLAREEYDLVLTKGPLSAMIESAFRENVKSDAIHQHCDSNSQVIQALLDFLPPHSLLLIKGSRSMELDEVAEQLQNHWGVEE